MRRYAWVQRQVALEDPELILEHGASPEQHAEANDLALALRSAIAEVLTPHQRRIVRALLVNEIPIDVPADRLGSSRNALYKTLHDARTRLRAHLNSTGHLADPDAWQAPDETQAADNGIGAQSQPDRRTLAVLR